MTRDDTKPARLVEPRRWLALGTVAATALAASHPMAADDAGSADPETGSFVLAQGEGGEGEGEGEGRAAADPATDDAAYLAALGLVEGHLMAGLALYEEGAREAAATHMKHPEDEIYASLAPALEARGAPGFANALGALAGAVESGAPVGEVRAAHERVSEALAAARAPVEATPAARFGAVVRLARTAAEEYGIGVVDGKLENAHEYQDAWGFLQVAKGIAGELAGSQDDRVAGVAEDVTSHLDSMLAAFPGVVPPETLATDASKLHGEAARIELAALRLD
mgnify:CR=1 FL=1